MSAPSRSESDRFGNCIDETVGYARGTYLRGPADEGRRLVRAWESARRWVADHGRGSLAIFTGTTGAFEIETDDLWQAAEWEGTGTFYRELRDLAVAHLGGGDGSGFGAFARTSAATLSFIATTASRGAVTSIVPNGARSHPSVRLAADLVGADFTEVGIAEVASGLPEGRAPHCVVITAVTSALDHLSDADLWAAVHAAERAAAPSLIDDAYGARMRPTLFGGSASLTFGSDAAVTNTDKAGLGGPRSAIVAGRRSIVDAMTAWAAERGMDARTPIMLAARNALRSYTPDHLLRESVEAVAFGRDLRQLLWDLPVKNGILGPTIDELDVLDAVVEAGADRGALVPAEASASVALHLLDTLGIATVNSHGQPGTKVSLRLKPVLGQVAKAGGSHAVADALRQAIAATARQAGDEAAMGVHLFGERA